jgi:hypothetical protein
MAKTTVPAKKSSSSGATRADRLAAIQSKLSGMNLNAGGSRGFWAPQTGRNVIRVLPETGDMTFFFQQVGKHVLSEDGKKYKYCPAFTSEGEHECPICDYVDSLYKAGDKGSKAIADKLRVKKMFWMNVVTRKDDGSTEGPFLYTPGVTVFNEMSSIIGDPDYGDFTDPDNGFDLIITREGEKMNTKYHVKARRNSSQISADADQQEKFIESCKDLSYVMLTDDPDEDKELTKGKAVWILPYDRLQAEFAETDLNGNVDEDEDDDEDEAPAPAKKAPAKKEPTPIEKARSAATTKAKKPVAPVVEEEDDEEEEEVEEEDEVDREVARRAARRRTR